MADLILHHYQGSPYAEKVRTYLEHRDLDWLSCVIPVVPPRASLGPILGAFRRTPVLQVGADYFCDTRLILEVIDAMTGVRPAAPSARAALSQILYGWAEPRVFVFLGALRFRGAADIDGIFDGEVSVQHFSADRLPFMRPAYDTERFQRLMEPANDHVSRYLAVPEDLLSDGAPFIGGEAPVHADFSAYHTVWWLRAKPEMSPLLKSLTRIGSWADRMVAIGHGRPVAIEPSAALDVARRQANKAWQAPWPAQNDPRQDKIVQIVPDDYGRDPLEGRLVAATDRHVAVERNAPGVGPVRVHFPRLGYDIVTRA